MIENWRPREGTLRALIKILRERPRHFKAYKSFANRIPQMTYPRGEKAYWKSVDHYGLQAVASPHNAWRFFCHVIGGWIFAFLLTIFLSPILAIGVVTLFSLSKEISDDLKEQHWKVEPKNFMDVFSWMLGALLILALP